MVIDLTPTENMIGKKGTCYMCGKAKIVAIQHSRETTENSDGPSRLICEDCAGLNDELFN